MLKHWVYPSKSNQLYITKLLEFLLDLCLRFDGGTGELDGGKGLARSEVSMGSSWRLSASDTCLEDDDPLRVGVDRVDMICPTVLTI